MLLINRKGEVKLFPIGYRLKGHRFKEIYIHRKEIETFRQQGGAITWEEYYQKVILPSLDPGAVVILIHHLCLTKRLECDVLYDERATDWTLLM